ncbi:MAG: YihY/virulence factor BrkB family protein [Myxococcota bacterium]
MVSLLIETWRYFQSHDGRLLSGAIAFYAALALAPLGVLMVLIASIVLPVDEAQRELIAQLEMFVGPDLAKFLAQAMSDMSTETESLAAPILGGVFMIYMSARLFTMLRRALNHMWSIRPKLLVHARTDWRQILQRRLLAFAMVLAFGASLIVLVLLHAVASGAARFLGGSGYLLTLGQFGSAFAVLTVLIALTYRWLPDAFISWRDVIIGAAVTSIFIVGGSLLIGLYLGNASPASWYGAAGSLIVLLLWIFYTTQIFLLGAVFTRAWARRQGRAIEPLPYAVPVETPSYRPHGAGGEVTADEHLPGAT